MKKIWSSALFIFAAGTGWAQQNQNQASLKLDLLSPGLSFEYGIRENQSVHLSSNIYLPSSFSSSAGNGIDFSPLTWQSGLHYRYYYNLRKRERKNRSTVLFSGNFLYAGLIGKQNIYAFSKDPFMERLHQTFDPYVLGVQAGWGFQRNYKSGWYIGMKLGVTHYFNASRHISPTIDFKAGYNLWQKNLSRKPRTIENSNIN